ncbi:hypothetical protein BBP00_00008108 [Phytophthora kernoviae]|uniref:ABC transporter domain-containing protein n=1 Tax=Phytophthora kernoviae TaxID=325452 RepID=A0A3F2RGB8_9STRA|nr:hypothetical protein BBP00_00008108 [Phytophthora kernoviae]
MADPSQLQDEVSETQTDLGTSSHSTRAALLKRNRHLQDTQMSSPAGFGGLGTRQFLQKQLMTPGSATSATSASSFEEGASYDGFSDAGTPGTDDGLANSGTQHKFFVRAGTSESAEGSETTQYVARTASKQPTKRLSSPSRQSLARRLMSTSTETHGMVENEEITRSVDIVEDESSDLPPDEVLTNLVVKRVPSLNISGMQTTGESVPLSPRQSMKVTRRIVASPRKTIRRRVIRTAGKDGKVHEVVQYVNAEGQVVENPGANFFDEGVTSETSMTLSGQTPTTRRISSPAQRLRRVVVRRTGADGQVHEEVQYMDADGNVVKSDGTEGSTIMTNTSVSTPGLTATTRIVTPSKLTRRTIRRTGVDGQVHEVVQYLDANGNIVRTEGDDSNAIESTSTSTSSTSMTVTPSKRICRVIVRRTGADGQVHEEVQFMDADGNVVQSNGSALVKTTGTDGTTSSSSTSDLATVARRVVLPAQTLRRVVIRRTGVDGQVHEEVQHLDADGNVVSSEGSALPSSGTIQAEENITEDPSEASSRRKVSAHRLVRRMVVGKDGNRVAVDQYVDSDGQVVEGEEGALVRTSSFAGSVSSVTSDSSAGGSTRRTITRRVVTPGRVVRRSTDYFAEDGIASSLDVPSTGDEEGKASIPTNEAVLAESFSLPVQDPSDYENALPTAVASDVTAALVGNQKPVNNDGGIASEQTKYQPDVAGDASSAPEATLSSVGDSAPAHESQELKPLSTSATSSEIIQESSENPQHPRRNSGGGFWGFFGRSEDEPEEQVLKQSSMDKSVSPAAALSGMSAEAQQQLPSAEDNSHEETQGSSPDTVETSEGNPNPTPATVALVSDAEAAITSEVTSSHMQSPKRDDAHPVSAAGITTDAALASQEPIGKPEGQPTNDRRGDKQIQDVTTSPEQPVEDNSAPADAVTTTSPTTEEVVEESRGGFWGFFGKTEPEEAPATTSTASEIHIQDTHKPAAAGPAPEEGTDVAVTTADVSSLSNATQTNHTVDEARQEVPVSSNYEMKSPEGMMSYVITDPDEDKEPLPAVEDMRASIDDAPVSEQMAKATTSPDDSDEAPVGVAAIVGIPAALIVGNALPNREANLKHPEPHRDAPASPAAPTSATSPAKDLVVDTSAAPMITENSEEEEAASSGSQRKAGRSIWTFWGGRDQDKTRSPLSGNKEPKQDESHQIAPNVQRSGSTPTPSVDEAVTAQTEFGAATEVTQTTIVVDEEEGSALVSSPPADENRDSVVIPVVATATVADVEEVANSQEPSERENTDRNGNKKENPPKGFWGLFGKKGKSEEKELPYEAAAASTAAAAAGSAGNPDIISYGHEGEESKIPAGQAHTEPMVADGHDTVQFERVRRSIPSEGTPKHAAAPTAVPGKPIRDSDRRTTLLIDGAEPDVELDEHYVQISSPKHGAHAPHDEGLWAVRPCSIAWNKLQLNRQNWKNAPEGAISSGNNEAVLNDVSGSVKAGEFLVITGPSKDESLALLSCLAGYEDAMGGSVTVNGRKWNEKMDRYIAYVMRENLFYETLTVHEHLLIQAQLRMRRTHTDEMCLQRVETVIEDMGLTHCRDELIGGGISLRGISRGERKLLALATALLTNPSILLVEEPTDGLDTFSAEKIVAKLRWLAFEKGLTVAVTLHHPSSHFYGLFDVLYLVADGSCVYDGKASDCVAYFSTIGYQCPEYMSPMDYFLSQMVVGDHGSDDEGVARVEMLKRQWSDRNAAVYAENEARATVATENAVVDAYDQKNHYYHMSCCGQLWLLWARHVRRLSRYGFVFWWHMLAALLIGVVFGLVYLQLDLNDQKGIQNFAGSFFYIVVVQMLLSAYRTFVFMPRETAIALRERHEYRGGWYHLLCWYFTKIIAELPALIILSIVLFAPVFLLVGIEHGFKTYVYMQIVIVLAGWAVIGLGFLALGVLRKVALAVIVYSVLLVLFVIFGGLLINVTDVPDWLVWLHYISPVKYGYEALMKIFWKRIDTIICDWTDPNCVAFTGDGVLKYYSMENRSALGDSLILLAICLGLFFVAFWFLLFLAKKRVSGLEWRYDWTFKGPLGGRKQRIGNAMLAQKEGAVGSSVGKFIGRKSHHSSSAPAERSAVADSDASLNHYICVETPRVGSQGICDAASITLGWSSLWLKVSVGKNSEVDGEKQHQQYLINGASGSAKCGELVLITGPSSESNMALLESLGGLQKRVIGKITMNGVLASAQKIADRSVFIPRDDLFYETLTVEEHLKFQAQLCISKSGEGCGLCCGSNDGELEAERVEMALEEMELVSKRHMLIRYLSPADVKLLAVAMSLLSNPSILLIEEPTHALDFYSSQRVVLKLRQLAREGRTVVVTMAHPSSHEYALFDVLYLLADGAGVYHGKVREAVPYFASLGYQCPQYMSPVDYFVRQVTPRNDQEDGQVTLFKEAWSTRYSGMLCLDDDDRGEEALAGVAGQQQRVNCCSQLSLLFRRHVLRLTRYHVVFGWHALWVIILGVIFGLIFLQLDLDDQQDIQNWAGAFFFIIVLQMLVIAYRTFVFLPHEMAIAEREHSGGKYYLVCWFLTKVFAELPALLILSILLFVPAYLLIGIGHGFKVYFYMQLVMWLAGWSAAGLATVLMGLFRHLRVAVIVYALLVILFVVFGGLLVNVDDVPDYLIWLHYISPVKYAYEALMKLFWGRIGLLACGESDGSGSGSTTFATVGDDSSFSMSGSGSADDGCIAHSGHEVLEHYSMDSSRTARSDTIILLEIAVLYFFIGYAFLSLRWRRYKTRQTQHPSKSSIN